MNTKKTVMVLPGTYWQLALIDKIREMGNRVLVVNPAPDSPGFAHADGYLQSDIFDKERVVKYGQDNHVEAVMSDQCDIAMNLIAELGEAFNAPTLDRETAALFTDKFLMREFCKTHGLLYPEYKLCKVSADAEVLLLDLGRPIIIKPLDSNASHGVFKCSTVEEIREHFDEAMSFSRVEKSVLAERFIEGTEFTIDSIKTPSRHYCLAISEKKHFKHNVNIANELLFSHTNPNYDYDAIRKANDAFVNSSNLQFGFTHAEYKCEDGKYYLIEIAARGGGNMISSVITQYMSGYDTYKYLVECSTGNIHDEDFSIRPQYKERVAVLKFFPTPKGGGRVSSIEGVDYLDSEKDIVQYKFNFCVGDVIEDAVNDSARIGFYIATCENMARLCQVMEEVERKVVINLE